MDVGFAFREFIIQGHVRPAADADRHSEEDELARAETVRLERPTSALSRLELKFQDKEAELSATQTRLRAVRDQLLTVCR